VAVVAGDPVALGRHLATSPPTTPRRPLRPDRSVGRHCSTSCMPGSRNAIRSRRLGSSSTPVPTRRPATCGAASRPPSPR
jgi:hypothetical protein